MSLEFIDKKLLYRIEKRWPGVFKWCQRCDSNWKNEKAIVHVLEQIDKYRNIKNYDAYADKIMKIQNGNFNEREFVATEAKRKKKLNPELKPYIKGIG